MKCADLHLHTTFSDGTYKPAELVAGVEKAGLTCIAVVDHDTVLGIQPTMEAAEPDNIEVIPGIEVSAEYDGLEIHILGYFIDRKDKRLTDKLNSLKKVRVERIHKIVKKLRNLGVPLSAESVFSVVGEGTASRLHIARAMLKEGIVRSIQEAFHRYIGDASPAYVLEFRFSPSQAIRLIKGAGGIPVLAHPYLIKDHDTLIKIIKQGMMGIEIYYPKHTPVLVRDYLRLAKKYNLLVTGGSDCHGNIRPQVKLGSIKLDYRLVEKLKEAREELI